MGYVRLLCDIEVQQCVDARVDRQCNEVLLTEDAISIVRSVVVRPKSTVGAWADFSVYIQEPNNSVCSCVVKSTATATGHWQPQGLHAAEKAGHGLV